VNEMEEEKINPELMEKPSGQGSVKEIIRQVR